MAFQDLDSIYRKRRSPWPFLFLLLLVAAVAATVYCLRDRISWPFRASPEATEAVTSAPASEVAEPAPPASASAEAVPASAGAASVAPAAAVPVASSPKVFLLPDGPMDMAKMPFSPAFKAQWQAFTAEGNVRGARDLFLAALPGATEAEKPAMEAVLGRLNMELVTTARPMPGKVSYVIQYGDTLAKLADRYVCPVTLIQKINRIEDASHVRLNQKVLVLDHPKFAVLVSKSANTLTLSLNGEFFKKYLVGTGVNASTPAGTYKMYDKIRHPSWWTADGRSIPYGDPENILGTHWLSLEATGDTPDVSGIGIHGTWNEDTLGKQSSAGCVRMRNRDVEELFTMLPRGTPVKIME